MATGYVCPVCDTAHPDAIHLANHLAVTASLGRTDHCEWLESHAPDWRTSTPAELAARVAPEATEIDVPDAVLEEPGDHPLETVPGRTPDAAGDAEVERVLSEARELTRRMYANEEAERDTER
ncbi:DUF5810 domain-containing protein [Natronobiforma cellulositropha]|uniref:DUF5810 domain-containing protein n=1 Tax=Natronobiforma cellulositropha TaxID=1679076 RepID=UPI0021D56F0D|nr:DUF5810 domain-containing protein [Natronobiforma cellulositropha]